MKVVLKILKFLGNIEKLSKWVSVVASTSKHATEEIKKNFNITDKDIENA